jgi:hypothetical protein
LDREVEYQIRMEMGSCTKRNSSLDERRQLQERMYAK